ncbi:hypothetical protein SHIRM173S_10265 [Streptomyces hirsutus]
MFTDNSGQKVVVGGGVFVVPFVQQKFTLELSSRHIPVAVRGAVTLRGVKANLEGVAIVKVGGTKRTGVRAAAQRFLDQQNGVVGFTQEVLSGALRSIVGRMSVEDIIRDRAAFAGQVAEEGRGQPSGQGLVLDAFQIQDITTEGSYLEDLGRPEAARAKQEADIAEAVARRASEQARLKAEEEIAIAQRTFALKQAEIKAETDEAAARADAAGPLAEAARRQEGLQEQEKVAARQAALTHRELDTKVRKPADAARYQAEQEAEARPVSPRSRRPRRLPKWNRLTGEGEKAHRAALADAVRLEGDAEAAAIAAKGSAEADAMHKKADAFERYGDAAVLEADHTMTADAPLRRHGGRGSAGGPRDSAASPVADTPPARYDDPRALVTPPRSQGGRPSGATPTAAPSSSNTQEPIDRAVRTVDHDSATGDRTRHSSRRTVTGHGAGRGRSQLVIVCLCPAPAGRRMNRGQDRPVGSPPTPGPAPSARTGAGTAGGNPRTNRSSRDVQRRNHPRASSPAPTAGTAHFGTAPAAPRTPRPVIRGRLGRAEQSAVVTGDTAPPGERNAESIVTASRQALADLLGADPAGIVFGRSATQLAYDFSRSPRQDVVAGGRGGRDRAEPRFEHPPLGPGRSPGRRHHTLGRLDPATGELTADDIRAVLSERTRLVAVTAASNLIGTRPGSPRSPAWCTRRAR